MSDTERVDLEKVRQHLRSSPDSHDRRALVLLIGEVERLREDANGHKAPRVRRARDVSGEVWAEMNDAVNAEEERVRAKIAAALKAEAVARFDAHGGRDPRGAAFWDAYVAINEKDLGR